MLTTSQALAPYITQAVGVDLSAAMVQEYNTSASNQGIPESEMHAMVGNLIDASSSTSIDPIFASKDFYDFDIAAVGLGWHHFPDPAYAAKQLAERLKVGGTLLIIDFLPHEGFEHDHGHGHSHGHGSDHKHGSEGHSHGHGHSHGEGKKDGYGDDKAMEENSKNTVMHFGFAEEDIKKMFEGAGVGKDFDFVVLGKGVVFEREGKSMKREVFMAKGRKG